MEKIQSFDLMLCGYKLNFKKIDDCLLPAFLLVLDNHQGLTI